MSSEKDKKKGVFIKFGELEHLRQLQSGSLYCNSLNFFAELEETNAAADKYENVTYLRDFSGGKISLWPAEEPMPENPLHMTPKWCQLTTSHRQLGNLFCVHFLDAAKLIPGEAYKMNVRNGREGNYFLVIREMEVFMQQILKAGLAESIPCRFGFVGYVDLREFTGKKDVFQKDVRFAHEQEWRAYFSTASSDVFRLNIGDISSISMLCCASLNECEIFLQDNERIGLSHCEILK